MAVVLDEGYTGLATATTLTTANTTYTALAGGPVTTNAYASFGDTVSMNLSGGSSARYGQKSIIATNLLFIRMPFKFVGNPGVTTYPANVLSGATIRANWRMNPSGGTVQMRNNTTAIGTVSPSILVAGTAYQSIWKIDVTNQVQRLWIYDAAGTTTIYDSGDVASALAGSIDTIQVGSTTTAGPNFYMGRVTADNATNPGPQTSTPALSGNLTGVGALSADVSIVYPAVDPIGLGWVGDSLTYQNGLGSGDTGKVEAIETSAVGWTASHVSVDGEIGRPIIGTVSGTSMQTVVDGWRGSGFNPYTFVYACMSNNTGATDSQWTTWLNTGLAKFAEDGQPHKVYIIPPAFRSDIDNGSPGGVSARFLAVAQALAPPVGITLVVIDYNTLIRTYDGTSGIWDGSDATGRHMTNAGYDLRNQVLAPQIVAPGFTWPVVTGAPTGNGALSAAVTPVAIISADMGTSPTFKGRLTATIDGVGYPVTGNLAGTGTLTATVTSRSVVSAPLAGLGLLSALVATRVVVTGTLTGAGSLSAEVSRNHTAAPPPAERTATVRLEQRVATIAADNRIATIAHENRTGGTT